ncbi:MAG TPA: YdcF family protein, partial [Polyangiaceae bacterium]|nr:YdcF family protein [Polyangiaceae bacterium]
QDERRADPELELLLELDSLTTKQNAACAAQLLLPRGLRRIGLVTCDFHMARARRCFVRRGFDVEPLPAASGSGLGRKLRLWSRERIAILLSAFEVEP